MELINALRTGTQDLHRRLEQLPLARALAEGTVARTHYAALLVQLFHLHRGLEAELAAQPALGAVYRPDMARLPALSRDLQQFGRPAVDLPLPAIADLVQNFEDWSVVEPVALLGSLYVVEGSRMGSLILGKSLARAFGVPLQTGVGLDYHVEGSAQRPQLWQQFLQGFEAAVPEPQRESVVTAAIVTFQALYDLYAALPATLSPWPVPSVTPAGMALAPARR
ncbi:MAG: biliverdin-producing heme oxygenase [Planctomycetia bacterium]|nr:biliverdin-producing heme oxygenase [Planctomycetia bacterium]